MPLILANSHSAYTAITVATWKRVVTSCAARKAPISKKPGRSTNDQLRERVTKMRAWLTILTCRYKAAIISVSLVLKDFTPNLSCGDEGNINREL
ncbi:hypothetical protein Hanom_Chr12g01073111 [Helianthus anomalus]